MPKKTTKPIVQKTRKGQAIRTISKPTENGPSIWEVRFVYFSAAIFTLLSVKCQADTAFIVILTVLVFAAAKMWIIHERMNPFWIEMIIALLLAGFVGEGLWLRYMYHQAEHFNA